MERGRERKKEPFLAFDINLGFLDDGPAKGLSSIYHLKELKFAPNIFHWALWWPTQYSSSPAPANRKEIKKKNLNPIMIVHDRANVVVFICFDLPNVKLWIFGKP